MPSQKINDIQRLLTDLQPKNGSLTRDEWNGAWDALIDKGLLGLDDKRKNEMLAFKAKVIAFGDKEYKDDDGDDSLACRSTEEREEIAEADRKKKRNAFISSLCTFFIIVGVSQMVDYYYEGTSIADVCAPFVASSLGDLLTTIPAAVESYFN